MNSTISQLNQYETIYVVKPELNEDNLLRVIENYQGILVERGAKNIITQNRGRRHLKYPISKFQDGVYIQMNYKANRKTGGIIDKSMTLNESILRY